MLINRQALAAVRQAAAKTTDHRYALHGVRVENDTIVSTDGNMLLYARQPQSRDDIDYPERPQNVREPVGDVSEPVTVMVPADIVDAAVKVGAKRHHAGAVGEHIAVIAKNGADGPARVVATTLSGVPVDTDIPGDETADRTFPAWEKVVPDWETHVSVTLSADILHRLAKAAKLSKGHIPYVTFDIAAPDSDGGSPMLGPVRVRLSGDVEVKGVVMPVDTKNK